MSCENYKSPKELGLRICTSDVPCYDGQGLECVDLPSNPSLNDVISSIDDAVCSLISLINSGGGNVPNDDWVELINANMSSVNWTGTDTGAGASLDILFQYKVTSPDSAIVKCNARVTATITGLLDFVNFNFTTPNVSGSNWFTGDKKFRTTDIAFTRGIHTPVSIIASDGTTQQYISKGRAFASDNIFTVGFAQPNIPNGTYDFEIDFEMTCRLIDV